MVKQTTILVFIMVLFFPHVSYSQSMQKDVSNYSPLHWAAAQGYAEMIKVLIDKGYDVNAQDVQGFTPLHYAAAAGSYQGVELLVNNGADVHVVNKRNASAMTIAAQAGEQKIVDFLFIKMRSTKVEQLKFHAEQERVNSDLIQAAKARSEAEHLRQQASEWTQEAEHWRNEAEKWTREANVLKEKQIQIDKLAKERYDQMMESKNIAERNYKAERLARTAAERVLREQSATTAAQVRAYEAQNAAIVAQRATDAAIDNLAEEFLRQGMTYNPKHASPVKDLEFEGYQQQALPSDPSACSSTISEEILNQIASNSLSVETLEDSSNDVNNSESMGYNAKKNDEDETSETEDLTIKKGDSTYDTTYNGYDEY